MSTYEEERAILEKYATDDFMPDSEFEELLNMASLVGRSIVASLSGTVQPRDTAALVLGSLQAAREMGRRAGEKAAEKASRRRREMLGNFMLDGFAPLLVGVTIGIWIGSGSVSPIAVVVTVVTVVIYVASHAMEA